jgi:acylphosphatase
VTDCSLVTRKYFFSGRVQGVGFRWTTRGIAARFSVRGYVKNLKDGRVEMVARGEPAIVTAFANAVATHFEENLHSTECVEMNSPEEFSGFTIRHK